MAGFAYSERHNQAILDINDVQLTEAYYQEEKISVWPYQYNLSLLPPELSKSFDPDLSGENPFYHDPTESHTPLYLVSGRENKFVSAHLRFGDLAAGDGTSFARIDDRLIDALEALIFRTENQLRINSAYRHPSLNQSSRIGGSARSQHMAGRAADISSPIAPPLDLAEIALEEVGCNLGLGLGRHYLHLDVRGELSTWTYDNAVMDDESFDKWTRDKCGLPESDQSDTTDVRQSVHPQHLVDAPINDYVNYYQGEIRAYAHSQLRHRGPGAVHIEFHTQNTEGNPYRLSYVPARSSRSFALEVNQLINRNDNGQYIVYAATDDRGNIERGIMGY